jgi:hypothetical protein
MRYWPLIRDVGLSVILIAGVRVVMAFHQPRSQWPELIEAWKDLTRST